MIHPKEDFIVPMAAFIGARLQYPCPDINGQGNPWVSTIHVSQHKNKFAYVVIYCDLANDDLVKQKWVWLRDREKRIAEGEKFYDRLRNDVIRAQLNNCEEPTDEFAARCLKHDAIHYRKCYRDMIALQPDLQSWICGRADHTELLYPTYVELSNRLDELQRDNLAWLQHLFPKYNVQDLDGLKAYLKAVYDPSMKDIMELRD